MAKKRIKAFGEWVEDHLRRACGALSPDKRIIVILTLLLFFSVLSLYFTVSSIYRFGKGAGERMQIRHIEAAGAGIKTTAGGRQCKTSKRFQL